MWLLISVQYCEWISVCVSLLVDLVTKHRNRWWLPTFWNLSWLKWLTDWLNEWMNQSMNQSRPLRDHWKPEEFQTTLLVFQNCWVPHFIQQRSKSSTAIDMMAPLCQTCQNFAQVIWTCFPTFNKQRLILQDWTQFKSKSSYKYAV